LEGSVLARLGVYKITNRINGHVYFGKSFDIDARWQAHRWHGANKESATKLDSYLYRAMKKYGVSNFDFETILEIGTRDNHLLGIMEKFFIREFHTFSGDPEYKGGYNETWGGEGISRSMPETQKENISKGNCGKPHLSMRGKPSGASGKKWSSESREKLSKSLRGHPSWARPAGWHHSPNTYSHEVRQRMSDAHKDLPPNIGWRHSDEAKKKMSATKKGRPATNLGVPRTDEMKANDRIVKLKKYLKRGQNCIKCIHRESNEIHYFVSTNEAAIRLTGLTGAMSTVQHILDNPNWISTKPKSKAWQILKDWKIECCPQSKLFKHRPELK
jgi:group I intron endonuclease